MDSLFIEASRKEVSERVTCGIGVVTARHDLEFDALRGGEQHDLHDRLSVDFFVFSAEAYRAGELLGKIRHGRRRPGVQAQSVHNGHLGGPLLGNAQTYMQ